MKILKVKCIIIEMKNLINEFNLRIRVELRIRKQKVRLLEGKGMKNIVESRKYIQDIVKKINRYVIGILELKRENCLEVIVEEI